MKGERRTVLILLLLMAFVCWPIGAGAGYQTIKRLSDAQLQMLLGWVQALGTLVIVAGVLVAFLLTYSRLRRVEEAEDDKRELALARIMLGQQAKFTYNVKQPTVEFPQPYVTANPQLVAPQQSIMEYKDIDLE